jgi:cardiolipin synthase (CMP-forming)
MSQKGQRSDRLRHVTFSIRAREIPRFTGPAAGRILPAKGKGRLGERGEPTVEGPEKVFNVPNLLSAYRIACVPVILCAIFSGHRMLFAWLIIANLLTDIADGMIARAWRLETALGAKLDSIGDIGTYALALLGMALFERPFIRAHPVALGLMVGFYLAPQVVSFWRFHMPISLHLYSSKATGYAQGIFFGLYFLVAYMPLAFYGMLAVSILNNVEELVVLGFFLPENRTNVRGLYWVLRERKHRE